MNKWVDVTEAFSEKERHYMDLYLEIDEVYNEDLEVSLFSSKTGPYEIYISYGIMYGIVYAQANEAVSKREEIKNVLEEEYQRNPHNPSSDFINQFAEKYKICLPPNVLFNEAGFMESMMKIWDDRDHFDF